MALVLLLLAEVRAAFRTLLAVVSDLFVAVALGVVHAARHAAAVALLAVRVDVAFYVAQAFTRACVVLAASADALVAVAAIVECVLQP